MASPTPVVSSVQSINPATGEAVVRVECTAAREIAEIFRRAREAQAVWAVTPMAFRCRLTGSFREALYSRREEAAELVTRETGKPAVEARFADVLISLETAKYYARRARRMLADERAGHQNLAVRAKTGRLSYEPFGVVAAIAPWNYPLAIPLGQAIPAVVAGNAVVLKPSEMAPGCGRLIGELFLDAGFPADLVQVVQGGPEAGAALVEARPDKIVFTGSTAAGKQLAAACARHLIPSVLELGGKDAMIVLGDADIERASSAAVWGAFTNCGQACVSTERIFVQQEIAARFIERCVAKTRRLRLGPGSDPGNEIGPMIRPEAVERIEAQLRTAESAGARILIGGKRRPELGPCYFEPAILTDVNQRMEIMREPIFGPVVAVQAVADAGEAVARTNDCEYGLSASIWTSNRSAGREIAGRIRAGVGAVMINDLASYYGMPEAPHGGGGLSGWGRTHSRVGLLEMVQVRYVDDDRLPRQPKGWWFGYDGALAEAAGKFIEFCHSPRWRERWKAAGGAMRALFRGHRI